MFKRQRTGSVVCTSCGSLVGVRDEKCFNCGRRNPGLWGFAPLLRSLGNDLGFVQLVLWGSGALLSDLATVIGTEHRHGWQPLRHPGSEQPKRLAPPRSRVAPCPVFGFGRWWTSLSAGWLHGSLLHIIFNMMWVRDLGPVVADVFGAGRMVIIYTVSGACGFPVELVGGGLLPHLPFSQRRRFTLGASAAIFGFLGALVYSDVVPGARLRGQACAMR